MKAFKNLIFTLLIILFFYAPEVLALKQVSFPNSSGIQPMPSDARPNISENVNFNTSQPKLVGGNQDEQGSLSIGLSQQPSPPNSNRSANKMGQENISFQHNLPWLIIFLPVLFLFFVFTLNKWKRKK